MIAWADDLYEQTTAGHAIVLVTVVAVRGSAPREVGTKMIVTASGCIGSIGGGQLVTGFLKFCHCQRRVGVCTVPTLPVGNEH